MLNFSKLGRFPLGLTVPAFSILLVVFGVPMVLLFLSSVNAPIFSFSNYEAFFSRPANIKVLIQTIEISLISTVLCLLLGYPTAYLITSASKQIRAMLITFVMISYLTSFLARTYAWIVILGDRGLVNNMLIELGLISTPLQLIYNRAAVYIGIVHMMLPIMILPLISVMMGTNKSLMAAARSMGARPGTAFWRVFVPLSLPGVRSGCVLVFVLCLGFYVTPAALGGLGDAMLSTFIAAQVKASLNLGPTAASSFILLAIALVVIFFVGMDLSGSPDGLSKSQRVGRGGRIVAAILPRHFLREIAAPYRAKRWLAELYKASGGDDRLKYSGISFLVAIMFFLLFPGVVVIAMSFSPGTFLEFPPSSLSLQWYVSFFGNPSWYDAMMTSIEIGLVVAALSTFAGTLAAYGISRSGPGMRSALTMAVLAPITFPVIVVGIGTYLGLVKLGLIGTETGIVLAHSIGAIGYVVVIVSATLANFDRRLEDAARSMRANPLQTFARVTLPLIRPGIIGGAVFAFLHSFDEVVITSLIGGLSIRTLPLKMWQNMRHQLDPTIAAVASLLMLLPIVWFLLLYAMWWRSKPRAHGVASEQSS
ncbi:ABC transporter permease subunit [Rhizobium mongolense]|uniref:Spermidine/putrescine transport system permease protein n=2 Tax=Rhizobium mongolense TaxID=57676 RepID=A0ABR6J0P8_9HYPH|nr:ABC transporter permease subunit [Rhizobium mongolense]MBB4233239.1 putative spermidine/putrescine transport system permease protein [Rhizobium mongolense]TVZ74957.1 putative spermidine/putrescine transport system permease protein [Rhizobium mongolense USDA 1844]